jgi:diacylglycerol kinase (ATP)
VSRRVALLVNPTAGKGKGARAGVVASRRLRDLGQRVDVLVGTDAVDAARLGHRALDGGADALAVVGGDGMVHLALQILRNSPQTPARSVPLGIIPSGSGNDFARAVGLEPHDALAAADVVAAGSVRHVDLGRVDGQWFGGVLSSGFDSRVNERANRMRWPRGYSRYNVAMLAELRVFRPLPFTLELDGVRTQTEAMLVAVGNGPSYGGGMRICPSATLSGGQFSVTILHAIGTAEFLRLFPRVYRGAHVTHPAVAVHKATTVRLESPQAVAYADGERVGSLPVIAGCTAAIQPVLVPASRADA